MTLKHILALNTPAINATLGHQHGKRERQRTHTNTHPARVLDHLHILLTKLVGVELEESLGDLRERRELGLLVDVLLTILILKEALPGGNRSDPTLVPTLLLWPGMYST